MIMKCGSDDLDYYAGNLYAVTKTCIGRRILDAAAVGCGAKGKFCGRRVSQKFTVSFPGVRDTTVYDRRAQSHFSMCSTRGSKPWIIYIRYA